MTSERTHSTGDQSPAPAADEIRPQLEHILRSRAFNQSARMSCFLRFVVDEALEGRSAELKETTIGVAVFERDPGYDPKTDPVVRNEARRLRNKLEQYYQSEAPPNALRIGLPKGGYVPSFDRAAVTSPDPAQPAPPCAPAPVKTPPAPLPKARSPWLAALAVALSAIAIALYAVRKPAPPPGAPSVRISPLTSYPGQELQPAVSPDGARVAFVWDGGAGNYDIYQKTLTGPPVRLTSSPDHDLLPAWSPDGRHIAFLRASRESTTILTVPADGGAEHEIRRLSSTVWGPDPSLVALWPALAWSRDEQSILVTDRTESEPGKPLYLVSVRTGQARRLTNPGIGEIDAYPTVSRDGQIAFVRNFSHSANEIYILPAEGGLERRVLAERHDIHGLAWTPDGRRLVFSSNRNGTYGLWVLRPGEAEPRSIPVAGESATEPSLAPDGRTIVYTDSSYTSSIWRSSLPQSGASERIISSSREDHSAQYSPDGKKIVFVSNRSGAWEVWTAHADGSHPAPVTDFHGPMVGTPRWSPDGSLIVFDARPEGHSAVFLARPGSKPYLLDPNSYEDKRPSWSRDGKFVYLTSNRGGSIRLWKQPVAGGAAELVCDCAGFDAQETFDRGTIYFLNAETQLWRLSFGGSSAAPVPGIESVFPGRVWTVARRGIYFIDEARDRRQVRFYDFASRRVTPVLRTSAPVLFGMPNISLSPEETRILYSQQDDLRSDLMLARGVF